MKNENGMTYKKLLFVIIILIFIAIFSYKMIEKIIITQELNDIKTNMLLIQGKSKLVNDKVELKSEGANLLGLNLSDNMENEEVKEILNQNIISKEEDDFKEYYLLSDEDIKTMELETINDIKNNRIIVNYKTGEVVYTKGFTDNKGNTYYKLTQMN